MEASYLAALHSWYTVDMPNRKAVLRARIVNFWTSGCGRAWQKVLSDSDSVTLETLAPEILDFDTMYAPLLRRCHAACEFWDYLVQLEVTGNNHVYFVGDQAAYLRRE